MSKKPEHTDEEKSSRMNSQTGFPALSFLAGDEDHFSMVFKRFDQLAAQSLAYMQSELAELQHTLNEMNCGDSHSGKEEDCRRECPKSWAALRDEGKAGNERFKLIMEIRSKLKDYRMLTLLKTNR